MKLKYCPLCKNDLKRVHALKIKGVKGPKYKYYCPECEMEFRKSGSGIDIVHVADKQLTPIPCGARCIRNPATLN